MGLKLSLATVLFSFGVGSSSYGNGPDNIYIKKVKAHGSGCQKDSVFIDISPDRQVFTAIFSEFQAAIDPNDSGVKYADRHKRCDLALQVKVPNGWQFSIFKADYEGWYDLEEKMSLVQTSTYHFQGNPRHRKRSVVSTRNTPKSGEFLFTDTMGVSSYEWSACGGPRNMFISAELRLSSSSQTSRGVAGIDAIEGQFKLKSHFGLRWRRC